MNNALKRPPSPLDPQKGKKGKRLLLSAFRTSHYWRFNIKQKSINSLNVIEQTENSTNLKTTLIFFLRHWRWWEEEAHELITNLRNETEVKSEGGLGATGKWRNYWEGKREKKYFLVSLEIVRSWDNAVLKQLSIIKLWSILYYLWILLDI